MSDSETEVKTTETKEPSPLRSRGRPERNLSRELRTNVINAVNNGVKRSRIIREYGISYYLINKIMSEG